MSFPRILSSFGSLLCLLIALCFTWQGQPTQAQSANSQSSKAGSVKTIADFRPATLSKIAVGKGVSIKRIDNDTLELRIAPFSEHGNQWPLIAFGPDFFGEPVNLAGFSRMEMTIEHLSEGMLGGHIGITTSPDSSRAVDEESMMVPGHNTMTVKLGLQALKFNDPSEISVIQIVFRPRETETVVRLQAIRGVYDPGVGSPADNLVSRMATVKKNLLALQKSSTALPLVELEKRAGELDHQITQLQPRQFYRALRSLSQQIDGVAGQLGRAHFAASGPVWVWEADRYQTIVRQTGPGMDDRALEKIAVSMAGNEFRDFVFFISASESELSLNLAIKPSGAAWPANAVEIREVDYRNNRRGDQTGDALVPVDGPVRIPQGESRQFWVRFNTRTAVVAPGNYPFELEVRDDSRRLRQVYPGKLEVWNFSLPSYDCLPNNSYAEFPSSNFASGNGFVQAVQHMKLYGLNQIFVHPVEMPVPKGLEESWKITGYDDAALRTRVNEALAAWKNAPGEETLYFILSISGFEELGLKRDGYAFPNDKWKGVFAQWLNHLKSIIAECGLKNDQWMLVLRDESGEPALMQVEIPLAEIIKSLDPSIRITCNSSAILGDESWTKRYFAAFDVFQPHLWRDETLAWLRKSGKELWVYQCECDLPVIGRDLYSYNRVYGWDLLNKGFTGTGLWTYSAQALTSWDDPGQGCLLIYNHPQHGLVHSPRYEMFREGIDDFRYVKALRLAAEKKGPEALRQADTLIAEAVKDVTANRQDRSRCETWRVRIAKQIVSMQ